MPFIAVWRPTSARATGPEIPVHFRGPAGTITADKPTRAKGTPDGRADPGNVSAPAEPGHGRRGPGRLLRPRPGRAGPGRPGRGRLPGHPRPARPHGPWGMPAGPDLPGRRRGRLPGHLPRAGPPGPRDPPAGVPRGLAARR